MPGNRAHSDSKSFEGFQINLLDGGFIFAAFQHLTFVVPRPVHPVQAVLDLELLYKLIVFIRSAYNLDLPDRARHYQANLVPFTNLVILGLPALELIELWVVYPRVGMVWVTA